MGIKYFFSWFKKTFSKHIRTIQSYEPLNVPVDTFLVDLNGIFHYCAQKAFQYGSFKPKTKDFKPYYDPKNYCFELVGEYIDQLIRFTRPKKRVVLCIDGVAPVSKQFQQRQRRFKSAVEMEMDSFDSNCITPGTQFMDELTHYLEWFIRKNKYYWGCEIVFSSEKVPGEGEHKLVAFVREQGEKNDSYMIHGMDADLIMLALASQQENFHVLRENPYRQRQEFFYVDMKSVRELLVHSLLHEPSMSADQFFINDFILMMFMAGNDFLPNLPTIDILEGSIETFFDVYRSVVHSYGNIVTHCHTLSIKPLLILIQTLAIERRKNVSDWTEYRTDYYAKKMGCHTEKDIECACHHYFDGMQWVLTYYLDGVSSWEWFYPYSYAPFCDDLFTFGKTYSPRNIVSGQKPYDPFFQLLCVLPPKSIALLPQSLQSIMTGSKTSKFYPEEIVIDMDGKRNDWEGIVLLPSLDIPILKKEYKKLCASIDSKDKHRNKVDKARTFI